jgi:hypothetical protein
VSLTPATLLWAGLVLACFVASVLGLTAPVWDAPASRALGSPNGEAAAHLWGLQVAAGGLLDHGPFLRVAEAAWPAGLRADLVDPLHLLLVAPLAGGGGGGGALLGWNLLPVVSLALGGAGGAWLGVRLGLGRAGAALLAGLVVCSPAFAGATVPVGRSEQLVLGWSVLHLAALHGALAQGGGRRVLVAGLTLGLQALGGWRPLMLLLFLELPLVLAWARGRGGWARAVAVGGIGALVSTPMLAAHVGVSPWWLSQGPWPSPFDHEVTPAALSSLLSLDGAGPWTGDPTANAGRVALVLAIAGAIARPRAAAPWLGLGLVLWVLAAGLRVAVGDHVGFGAAAWLSWVVPPLRAVHGWPRLAPLALVPLAVAAARGLDGPGPRRAVVVVLGLALAAIEGIAWRPVGQGSVDPTPPPAVRALPPGALVWLPTRPAPGPVAQGAADRALLWAHAVDRPTTVTPSPWPSQAEALLGPLAGVGRPGPPSPCAPDLAPTLRAAGAGAVVLDLGLLPGGRAAQEAEARVRAQLGEPNATGEGWRAWALDAEAGCGR